MHEDHPTEAPRDSDHYHGYESRMEGEKPPADASQEWLDGWNRADREIKAIKAGT